MVTGALGVMWGLDAPSGCTVASEVAGVAWVSKEPRPQKKEEQAAEQLLACIELLRADGSIFCSS